MWDRMRSFPATERSNEISKHNLVWTWVGTRGAAGAPQRGALACWISGAQGGEAEGTVDGIRTHWKVGEAGAPGRGSRIAEMVHVEK